MLQIKKKIVKVGHYTLKKFLNQQKNYMDMIDSIMHKMFKSQIAKYLKLRIIHDVQQFYIPVVNMNKSMFL